MLQKLDMLFLQKKMQFAEAIDNFVNEEKGASDMVAVMVLIVVVIGAAVIFRDKLTTAVGDVFDKLTTFISTD